MISIQSLVFGIALGILQQVQEELSRLQGPSCLGVATDTSHEPSEWDDLLVGDHVLQIFGGAVEGHSLDGLGCLPGILEVNPQVGSLGLCGLGGIVRFNSVATHGFSCRSESSNISLVAP